MINFIYIPQWDLHVIDCHQAADEPYNHLIMYAYMNVDYGEVCTETRRGDKV